jgi:hypothetical protein
MNPSKPPTPRHVPRIDWPNLTDEALEELRTLVEAEQQRRWRARQPRAPVDELYDSAQARQPAHAEAFDTYHCVRHGTRRLSRGGLAPGRAGGDLRVCVYALWPGGGPDAALLTRASPDRDGVNGHWTHHD